MFQTKRLEFFQAIFVDLDHLLPLLWFKTWHLLGAREATNQWINGGSVGGFQGTNFFLPQNFFSKGRTVQGLKNL